MIPEEIGQRPVQPGDACADGVVIADGAVDVAAAANALRTQPRDIRGATIRALDHSPAVAHLRTNARAETALDAPTRRMRTHMAFVAR